MPANACPFVWYELMTSDPAAAETFYRQVIGWSAAAAPTPGMKYTIFSAGTTAIGGMMALPDDARARGVPPNWTGYVGVADVDAMAARVREAGGSIHHPPGDIPGVGRFAVIADPHGAVLCLFKGNLDEPPPQPPDGTPGTIGWHELAAGDLDAAWTFYSTLFGWTKAEAIDMGELGPYQLFAAAGPNPIGGMMKRAPQVPMACWLYYIVVDAIDAAIARVTAGGGKVVSGAMEVPGGDWVAHCADPQGAMFALVAPKR